MSCLDNVSIEDLALGRLTPEAQEAAYTHLDSCDDCSRRVAGAFGLHAGPERANVTTQLRPPASDSGAVFAPGTIIKDRYQVVRRVGAGGSGEVFEVRHLHLPTRLALKVLHDPQTLTTNGILRFRREARVLAELKHANIVGVVDFDFLGGRPFLVMEFIEGKELAELIEPGRGVDDGMLLSIVRQVCSALSEIHRRGMIHRDLKPQNILVMGADGSDPVAKIVDFGLARARECSTIVTAAQAVIGTPLYMSPEQAEGRNDEIDVSTDQFSLGAICYELLTGHPAFQADSLATTLHNVVSAEPPPMNLGHSHRAAGLEPVVRRALAKKVAHRYPSVDEFWRAFSFGWHSSSEAAVMPSSKPTRGRAIAAGVAVTAAAALLVARLAASPRAAPIQTKTDTSASAPAKLVPGDKDDGSPHRVTASPKTAPKDSAADAPGPDAIGSKKRGPTPSKRKPPPLFENF